MKRHSLVWTDAELKEYYLKKGKPAPIAKQAVKKPVSDGYDSKLERMFAIRLQALKMAGIITDWLRITKDNAEFNMLVCGCHHYRPDFVITLLSGKRVIIETKGFSRRDDELVFDDASHRYLFFGWLYLVSDKDGLRIRKIHNITKGEIPKELL